MQPILSVSAVNLSKSPAAGDDLAVQTQGGDPGEMGVGDIGAIAYTWHRRHNHIAHPRRAVADAVGVQHNISGHQPYSVSRTTSIPANYCKTCSMTKRKSIKRLCSKGMPHVCKILSDHLYIIALNHITIIRNGTKRYAQYPRRMPGEQGEFFTSLCIVEPNTEATSNGITCSILRVRDSAYPALSQACDCAIR